MADFTHSLALVIGIDAYGSDIPQLTTAVNDATRLAELLRTDHGYETVLLTEQAIGQPVTLERLRTFFMKDLPAQLGDDDRLLVYFAGHGVALDGDDGPRGYLVPQDGRPGDSASMLAMTDLHVWLTALPCPHMLAILDCCFAGAFRWSATRDLGALPDVIHKERYDRYLLSPAWQVLTSAAYDQKALDVLAGDAKRGALAGDRGLHSPFALALFDALAGAGDVVPTQQGDGVITASELFVYLQDVVSREAEVRANHEQMPGLWPLNKHRKGEFIFLVPGHPLNLPPAPALTDEANPYRGLKSYDQKHAQLFFGRNDEIEELAALVDRQPFVAVLGASGTGKSSLVKAGVLTRLQPNPPPPFPPREGGARDGLRDQFHDFEILSPPGGRGDAPSEFPSAPGGRGDAPSEFPSAPGEGAGGGGVTSSELPSPPRGGAGGGVSFAYQVLSPIRPTDQPVRALAALLRAELGEDAVGPTDGDAAVAQIVARWAAIHLDQRLVLTIDQFEELVTLCRDDVERERFLRLLATAVQQQPDVLRLIITLRTDFEPQFTQEGSPLAGAWQQGRYVVPPMDIEDLRQVIEGPASVRVLYFDPPELVDELIKEVIQTPGALPLLSFTLSELYVKYVRSGRDDRALTGADYQALGGVVGSLRNRATEEYDALPDDAHRQTMHRVMLRMVATEGGDLARRRVALSELEYPTAGENGRVKMVLDRLVDARLLVRGTSASPDGTKGEAYVEPVHDALVLAWDKLLRWKKEAEEYLSLQRRLAQAAGEWSKAQPEAKSGLLWDDDPRLPQVEETLWPTGGKQRGSRGRIRWARQVMAPKIDAPADTEWVNGAELAFVQASVRARALAIRRVIGVTIGVLGIVAILGLAWLSSQQRATATEKLRKIEAERADTNGQLAKTNQELAVQERAAKEQERVAKETEQGLRTEVERLNRGVLADQLTANSLRIFSEDSSLAIPLAIEGLRIQHDLGEPVVGSAQNYARRLLADNLDLSLSSAQEQKAVFIGGLALSPNGDWFVTSNAEGTIAFSPTQELTIPGVTLDTDAERIVFLTFGPAFTNDFVAGTADGQVILGKLTQESKRSVKLSDARFPVVFSKDGRQVATASRDNNTLIWQVDAPDAKPLTLKGAGLPAVSGSSSINWLATLDSTHVAAVWNLDASESAPIVLHNVYYPVSVSPDGRWLAGTRDRNTVVVWDMNRPVDAPVLEQKGESAVIDLEFAPTSQKLLVVRSSQIAELLDPISPAAKPIQFEGVLLPVAFSPDGQYLAVSSREPSIQIASLDRPGASRVILERIEAVNLAFTPDGLSLVSAAADGTMLVNRWRVQDLIELGCQSATRNLTKTEWKTYLSSMPYHETCRGLSTPPEPIGMNFLGVARLSRLGWFVQLAHITDPVSVLGDIELYDISIVPAEAGPNEDYWRAIGVYHLTSTDNQGMHHVFIDVVDENGNLMRDQNLRVEFGWEGQAPDERPTPLPLDGLGIEPAADLPLWRAQHAWVSIDGNGLASDRILNLHTDWPDESTEGMFGNSLFHHSYYVVFQRSREPGISQ